MMLPIPLPPSLTSSLTSILALMLLAGLVAAASMVDLRERRLPDRLTAAIFLAGLTHAVISGIDPLWRLIAAAAGGGAFLLVATICRTLSGRDGLGGGDIKLIAALGTWVGLEGLAPLVSIAAISALLAAGFARFAGITIDRETHIPFGPFLGGAGLLMVAADLTGLLPWRAMA